MSEIRLANTLLIELTLLTRTMPSMQTKARMRVPTAGVLSLPWMVPNTFGKTWSRAIDRVIRAAGSRVVCVVATVEEITATIIT